MAGKGGARPNAGRKRKHIKLADVIKNHCEDFIIELLKDKEINARATREVQSLIEFEDDCVVSEDYIYIIKSNGKYKIGYTSNLKSRLKDYKIHFGLVDLVYVYKGLNCFDLEQTIHNMVNSKKINGEWFDLNNQEVLKIIMHCSSLIN